MNSVNCSPLETLIRRILPFGMTAPSPQQIQMMKPATGVRKRDAASAATGSSQPSPVTVARLERGLDRLAEIMVDLGDQGAQCLPIYERLEEELEALVAKTDQMAKVRARLKRSTRHISG
jgi:hypothetical protein